MCDVRVPVVNSPLVSQDQVNGWYALLLAYDAVAAQVDEVLKERHRLSFSAVEILCQLNESEPQAVRSLASHLISVSPTRASRLVQELIDAGHLERSADQHDGRVSLISLTTSGRHFAKAVEQSLIEAVKIYFLDKLDDDDIAALSRVWAKLEKNGG